MEINIGNINALSTKLSMAFAQQLKTVEPTYTQFSLTVPSTSGENFYPRLAELPGLGMGWRPSHPSFESGCVSYP
ncbi:hypothetical protein CGLAMM_01145 [Acetobacteraceae bacterium EV16G]